jgi:hypothetical protein
MDDKDRREARRLFEASSIDKLFGTWPWLTAIFSVCGIIAAFVNLFRMARGGPDGR